MSEIKVGSLTFGPATDKSVRAEPPEDPRAVEVVGRLERQIAELTREKDEITSSWRNVLETALKQKEEIRLLKVELEKLKTKPL